MHHDDESALPAKEVYEELEEGVYRESLETGIISNNSRCG